VPRIAPRRLRLTRTLSARNAVQAGCNSLKQPCDFLGCLWLSHWKWLRIECATVAQMGRSALTTRSAYWARSIRNRFPLQRWEYNASSGEIKQLVAKILKSCGSSISARMSHEPRFSENLRVRLGPQPPAALLMLVNRRPLQFVSVRFVGVRRHRSLRHWAHMVLAADAQMRSST
jgi:hypothetical protein